MATKNPYNDFMKMFSEFKAPEFNQKFTPAFDMSQVASIGRRNAEAFSAASTVMADTMKTASRTQAESVRTNVESILNAAKDMMSGTAPKADAGKQAELTKAMLEASINNMRTMSEMMTKSSFEALEVINKRTAESIEEINGLAKKAA